MTRIYLDYAATTPVDPAVFRSMRPYFSARFGNPSSLHSFGQEAMAAVDQSRETIAQAIGAGFREIIFTGSATEANNLALRGAIAELRRKLRGTTQKNFRVSQRDVREGPRPRVITSAVEHESVLETCRELGKEGVEIVYVKPRKDGVIDPRDIERVLNERTILVSIMYANNEIGTIQPLAEISRIIKDFRYEIRKQYESTKIRNSDYSITGLPSYYPLLHTDAVQAFQFLDCNVDSLGVDVMTLSAHKIYGPKGIGALYARGDRVRGIGHSEKTSLHPNPCTLAPIITGGGQEFSLRSGTENVPSVAGFGKAVELVRSDKRLASLKLRRSGQATRIEKLRDNFWMGIKKIYPRAQTNGDLRNRLPNNLNVYFPGHKATDLLMKLDLAGIAASSGSACRARSSEPSYVLSACGLLRERVESSVRFSIGRPTTDAEIRESLKRMRAIFRN